MYQQRISAGQLVSHYRDGAAALAAGDFFTALRMCPEDPEIAGICRVMLGNEVAGTMALDGIAKPSPRALAFSALGHWLLGREQCVRERLLAAADSPLAQGLSAAMRMTRPRIAFFSGNEKLMGFVQAVRDAGVAELVTIGHRPDLVDVPITPATDAAAFAAAVGPVDALYIDNLTILPPQLAAIDAPKVCQVYDVEHSYAARGRETAWVDWLVAGTSGEHFETSLRAERPVLLRGIGLTELWPDLSGLRDLSRAVAAPRPIDILYTGGIDMPFYPDKRIRLTRLAHIDPGIRVEIHGRMLARADYFQRLAQAKFVFSSTRSTNSTPKRLLESLSHGALPLCEQGSSLDLLFDCGSAIAKTYDDRSLLRDVRAHVENYGTYVARLSGDNALATRLLDQLPTTDRAARGFVRYVTLLASLTRRGVSWGDILGDGAQEPERTSRSVVAGQAYAAKHSDMQAYQPALRRTLFAPLAHGADVPLAERLVGLASLSICDRQEHLLRRQPLGRKIAAPALMVVLNRARHKDPGVLTTWVQLAELLVDVDRLRVASRLIPAIEAHCARLDLESAPSLVTPAFEYEDFWLVDSLIRESLSRRDPQVFPPRAGLARAQIAMRLIWLRARVAQAEGDWTALGAALDELYAMRPADPWLLEQAMLLAAAGARSDQPKPFLTRLCLFYLRGARRCPRFLSLHFPLALQAMVLAGRGRLAQAMIPRFLRVKARIHMIGGDMPVTPAERNMLSTFGDAIGAEIARFDGSSIMPPLDQWRIHAAAA